MACSTPSIVIVFTTLKPTLFGQSECSCMNSCGSVSTASERPVNSAGTVGGILRHVPLVVYDWLSHVFSPCFAFPVVITSSFSGEVMTPVVITSVSTPSSIESSIFLAR